MNIKKKIIHISGGGILKNTGFSQQIFIEILELRKRNYDVSLVVFCHIKFFFNREVIKNIKKKYNNRDIEIYLIPTLFNNKFILEFVNFPVAWLFFSYFICIKRISVFHFHNFYFVLMFLPFKIFQFIRIFIDVHGVVVEEGIFRNEIQNNSFAYKYVNFQELLAFKSADKVFCVSQNMINFYSIKHDIPVSHFSLTRSSFDPEIFTNFKWHMKKQAKEMLGLQGKKVLLYMGHKSAWHQTDEIIELFSRLRRHIESLYFCFLTNDSDSVFENCKKYNISSEDFMVKYVRHEDVPIYSLAADVAFLTREDSIVNKVSSPVKFSEYLASGDAVIITNTVGDLPNIVNEHGIGSVYFKNNIINIVDFLNKLFISEDEQKKISYLCREVAEKYFSVKHTVDKFVEFY